MVGKKILFCKYANNSIQYNSVQIRKNKIKKMKNLILVLLVG